ncbi:hypothetical protein FOHLNKBM_0683 [Methylobacterium longum]|nr:hypothetical protein FOHLNKBM_0683 [Methylobacterium longum]
MSTTRPSVLRIVDTNQNPQPSVRRRTEHSGGYSKDQCRIRFFTSCCACHVPASSGRKGETIRCCRMVWRRTRMCGSRRSSGACSRATHREDDTIVAGLYQRSGTANALTIFVLPRQTDRRCEGAPFRIGALSRHRHPAMLRTQPRIVLWCTAQSHVITIGDSHWGRRAFSAGSVTRHDDGQQSEAHDGCGPHDRWSCGEPTQGTGAEPDRPGSRAGRELSAGAEVREGAQPDRRGASPGDCRRSARAGGDVFRGTVVGG